MQGRRAVGRAEPEPKTHKAATARPPIPPRQAEDPGGRARRGRSRGGGSKCFDNKQWKWSPATTAALFYFTKTGEVEKRHHESAAHMDDA